MPLCIRLWLIAWERIGKRENLLNKYPRENDLRRNPPKVVLESDRKNRV
jgi:hypothetical protein